MPKTLQTHLESDFPRRPRSKRYAGFTLVEIMVVIVIIGLLAAMALPRFQKSREQSRLNACLGNLRVYQGAIEQYGFENLQFPEAIEDLVASGYVSQLQDCPLGGPYTWSSSASRQKYHLRCSAQHTSSISHVCIHQDQPPRAK